MGTMGTPIPRSSSAAPLGETIIFSAPKAVVEISEAAGAKTQPQLAVICSLVAGRVATDIPLGSTPAIGAAVLGSPTASDLYDLNQTPNKPELPAVTPTHSKCLGDHFSTVELCFNAAVNVTEMANVEERADFSSCMCDKFPPDASTPSLFSAQLR